MKSSQRLEYHRLVDGLVERGLVSSEAMTHVMAQCATTGQLLPEVLTKEDLVSDWEIARVSCEIFNLPFLDVETYAPSRDAAEGLDPDYLRFYALVPLDRFGKLLTVAMPGIVPSEVLDALCDLEGGMVIPVVGSVQSNRQWLAQNLPDPRLVEPDEIKAALPEAAAVELLDGWAEIFDAGDQAVQLDLQEQLDLTDQDPEVL